MTKAKTKKIKKVTVAKAVYEGLLARFLPGQAVREQICGGSVFRIDVPCAACTRYDTCAACPFARAYGHCAAFLEVYVGSAPPSVLRLLRECIFWEAADDERAREEIKRIRAAIKKHVTYRGKR